MLTGNDIRKEFLNYFKSKGHTVVPSGSLVPHEDPTLLFTNAGMNQFKDVFLGLDQREYTRATSSQKCVRAGGKHNDLDTVGKTARHHTFFEMLGNFSFGDYFKTDAILYAWEFLTEVLGLPKDKLWVTVYKDDDEAERLWKTLTDVRPSNMLRLGDEDNFWSMGDVGPCGPCSEILYDRGASYACGETPCAIGACDCDRWLELWNLVFMEYDRDRQGILHPLPKPSIDTGMGLERITSVMQEKDNNYEIDLIRPLIGRVELLSKKTYRPDGLEGLAMRVIADHARSTSFLISDGIMPGNEGRGYVLRRILRRAIRFGKVLGIHEPFMHELVDAVVELMGETYPELSDQQAFIKKTILVEEERFQETIDAGMKVAAEMVAQLKKQGKDTISGDQAFRLYDTYGFPFDLTEDIALENHLSIDEAGFVQAMEVQKERARKASGSDDAFANATEMASLFQGLPPTCFCGYEQKEQETRILVLADEKANRTGMLAAGQQGYLLLEVSPFYGESGGQIGDTGYLYDEKLAVAEVLDTKKTVDGRIYAWIKALKDIKENDKVRAEVLFSRRESIARNHSATHLLHSALKQIVGPHANQKGSLVTSEKLRFDYNHFQALTVKELHQIEDMVNASIMRDEPVVSQVMDMEKAQDMGATALFGEKYGQEVRVVRMSDESLELCGGTHVERTGNIGPFKITSETGIGSGLRRIEAITGQVALAESRQIDAVLKELSDLYKAGRDDIVSRASQQFEEIKKRDDKIRTLQARLNALQSKDLLEDIQSVAGVDLLVAEVDKTDMDGLRKKGDAIKEKMGDGVLVLGTKNEDKVNFLVMVFGSALEKQVHAGKLVKQIALLAGGGGGGTPHMAQAGGKKPEKLTEALAKTAELLQKQLIID